jgi:hypothetical protein
MTPQGKDPMKKNYVSRIILNFTKDVCAYPGDICIYDYTSHGLSIYRGGDLVHTTDEITVNSIKSMIDMGWLHDAKTKAKDLSGASEEEIISLDMEVAPSPNAERIEVAPKVEVVDWNEEEVIPMPDEEGAIEGIDQTDIEVAEKPVVEIPAEEEMGEEEVEVVKIEKEEGVGAASDSDGGDAEVVTIAAEPEVKKKSTRKK